MAAFVSEEGRFVLLSLLICLIASAAVTQVAVLSTTIYLHRTATHKALELNPTVGFLFKYALWLTTGLSTKEWVAVHRKHHAFTDVEGDPHSPHVSGPGVKGKVKGLWHAHMGWFFSTKGMAETELRFRRDLDADPVLKTVDRLYFPWILLTLGIPFAVGYAVGGTLWLGFEAMVWGGLVRIFLGHHITWSINSICHMFGSRPYKARDESRNNFLLALPSFGESWHNNHHAFPASAIFGIDRGQLDLGALTIRLFERLGLVWNVNAPNESQRALRRASA